MLFKVDTPLQKTTAINQAFKQQHIDKTHLETNNLKILGFKLLILDELQNNKFNTFIYMSINLLYINRQIKSV